MKGKRSFEQGRAARCASWMVILLATSLPGCGIAARSGLFKTRPQFPKPPASMQAPASMQERAEGYAAQQSPSSPADAGQSAGGLRVRVSGVQQGSGPVRIATFADASTFPNRDQASSTAALPSTGSTVDGSVDASGNVALAAYQDLNNDGTLNRSSFGMPTEPYGFSNNARGQFGPPSFEQASVQVAPNTTVEIELN